MSSSPAPRAPPRRRAPFGVTLAVTGSVHRVEQKLLLTAALEDARLDRVLRAVTADSPEALVERVVEMLELELGKQADAALRGSRSGVAEAATLASQGLGYTPYAEGRTALERYEQQQSLERAVSSFNQALERDPATHWRTPAWARRTGVSTA